MIWPGTLGPFQQFLLKGATTVNCPFCRGGCGTKVGELFCEFGFAVRFKPKSSSTAGKNAFILDRKKTMGFA